MLNQLATPVFYDLKANQWTGSFTSKNANVGDENHLPSSGQGRNDNLVIIGSTVAVAVVMLGVFMLVRYRYFRKSQLQRDEETRPMEDDYTRPTSLEGTIFRGPHACYKENDRDDTHTYCTDKEANVPAQECTGGRRGRSPQSLILSAANNGHLTFSALSPPLPPQAITSTSNPYQGNDSHAENRPSEYSSFFSKSEQDMYNDSNEGYSACVTLVPTSPSPPTSPYSVTALAYPQTPIPPKGYSRSIPLEDEKRMLQMQLDGPHNPNSITSGSLPPVPPEMRRSSDDIVLFRQIGTNVNDSTRSLDIPRRNPQEHPCEDRQHLRESEEREQRKGRLSWLQSRVAKWIGK
jgi:hypothetical protein